LSFQADPRLAALLLCQPHGTLTRCAPLVAGLLNHTTKWLTQAATQLIAPSGSCYDIQDPSSSSGPSPSDIAIPEPLSPAMVLSQGFLNLLTWDPENEEFPEVEMWEGGISSFLVLSFCQKA